MKDNEPITPLPDVREERDRLKKQLQETSRARADAERRAADRLAENQRLITENKILIRLADYALRVTEGGGPGSHLGLDQALEDWQDYKARVSGSQQK